MWAPKKMVRRVQDEWLWEQGVVDWGSPPAKLPEQVVRSRCSVRPRTFRYSPKVIVPFVNLYRVSVLRAPSTGKGNRSVLDKREAGP